MQSVVFSFFGFESSSRQALQGVDGKAPSHELHLREGMQSIGFNKAAGQ
jgi:hypothetical protein